MGDTLIFPALTVHKALPNYTQDQLRLSLDNRYQAVGDSIAEHMLEPHGPSGLSWDQIYPDWSADDLKHYWKSYDNPVVPRDMSFSDRGFAEALELARAAMNMRSFACSAPPPTTPTRPTASRLEPCWPRWKLACTAQVRRFHHGALLFAHIPYVVRVVDGMRTAAIGQAARAKLVEQRAAFVRAVPRQRAVRQRLGKDHHVAGLAVELEHVLL